MSADQAPIHAPEPDENLDISRVTCENGAPRFPQRLSAKRGSYFQTVIKREVLEQIHAHGREITDVEICGVLVGTVQRDDCGPYLLIDGSIRGSKASSHAAQVTFTADTWAGIQETMDREHPNGKIVGWYHTHPGFGVFLSGMDHFIQNHFFNLPWQVALVYDPLSGEEGLFVWKNGRSEPGELLIEEPPPDISQPPAAAPQAAGQLDRGAERVSLIARLNALSVPQVWALSVVLFVASFLATTILGKKFVELGRNAILGGNSDDAPATMKENR